MASRLCVSDVITVGVAEQNHMHVAKPRVRRAGNSPAGIVKNPHSCRVFKKQCTVILAKFPGMRAERCNFYSLRLSQGPSRGREND